MNAEDFKQKVLPVNQKLFRLCFRILENYQEAEDIVQEVYIKLWNLRDNLEAINNIEAYATTICKNLCLDKLKAKHTFPIDDKNLNSESNEKNPHQFTENVENLEIIKRIINSLPDQQKNIMVLRDIQEYSFEEIQEITGFNMNYIRVTLSRARKIVRNKIIKIHEFGIETYKRTSGEIL